MLRGLLVTLMLGIHIPLLTPQRGILPNDVGVLLPRLTPVSSTDPSWCGEYIVHHPSPKGATHMVTLRFVILGDQNQLESFTLEHDLIEPSLDDKVAGRPLIRIIQMSNMKAKWIDIRMNKTQLDEAKCLKK